ncbi:hypothetical protein TNCV_1987571 [Trichonephila clavipes]|nr:hypothetical protein TNCV_1987571 [Trichonephila clavipes]
MSTLRLPNLAILAIEHDIHIDIDNCIKYFAMKKTRKLAANTGEPYLLPALKEIPAQVSSTSLDHGSRLRDPLPKALVWLNSVTLIFTHLKEDAVWGTFSPRMQGG